MAKIHWIAFISCFCLKVSFLSASVWYVAPVASGGNDANPGTISQPFFSIYPAAVAVAQPGDTIYMRGGTYFYSDSQWVSCSGNPSAWITLGAYPGEAPIIDGSSVPASLYAVSLYADQYIVVQGLRIQNATNGISSWNASHLQILSNRVSGSVSWGITSGGTTLGMATDILIDGNTVSNNDLANNPPCSNCGWPAALSTYWADGVTVSNNNCFNNYGEGIAISHSEHISVLHNQSHDNYSVEIYMDNDQYCTIGGNLVFSTFDARFYRYGYPSIGISCANENYTTPHPLNSDVIVNNVAVNNRYGFNYGNFQNGGGMKNFVVANNTFYGAQDTLISIDPDPGHINNLIVNNVFWQTGGNIMSSLGAPTSAFTIGHNAWYGGGPGAMAGGGDLLLNPLLGNPGTDVALDYVPLAGSPLIDAGEAVPGVNDDYRGVSRPKGAAYDIGAFEVARLSPTVTPTQTPCGYPGNTCTPTVTSTPTASPNPNDDIPWPNPWNGKVPLAFFHTLTKSADSVRLKLYTMGYRKVYEDDALNVQAGQHLYDLGWTQVGNIANGFYYLVVDEVRGGRETNKVMKLLIFR